MVYSKLPSDVDFAPNPLRTFANEENVKKDKKTNRKPNNFTYFLNSEAVFLLHILCYPL